MKNVDDMINDVLDEVMNKMARMKRSRMMKTKGKQIARKRKIAMKRKANPEKLKQRAMKKARDIVAKKILKDYGAPVSNGIVLYNKNEIDEKIKVLKCFLKISSFSYFL